MVKGALLLQICGWPGVRHPIGFHVAEPDKRCCVRLLWCLGLCMLDGQSVMRQNGTHNEMSSRTRPRKLRRVIDYTCADGIKVDVAKAVQDVAFAVGQARFITSFP